MRVEIYNADTAEFLGVYEGKTRAEVLDVMARDYGFADYNAVIAEYGVRREDAIAELRFRAAFP